MDFSGLLGLWAKDTKGTAKKARATNANTLFIIHFLLLIITLEAPPGVSCVKNAIGELYVVNSLYSFSCEINTNYVCGCICINLRGEGSRINCSKGLKVVSQPLLRFSLPREMHDGRSGSRASWLVRAGCDVSHKLSVCELL